MDEGIQRIIEELKTAVDQNGPDMDPVLLSKKIQTGCSINKNRRLACCNILGHVFEGKREILGGKKQGRP